MKIKLLTSSEVEFYKPRMKVIDALYSKDDSFDFKPGYKVFAVIEDDGVLSAFATLCTPHGFWWLRHCMVHENYRGRKYQYMLILARVEYARARGARTVTTAVDQMNVWSLNNLVNAGFRFVKGGKLHNGHLYQKLQITLKNGQERVLQFGE